MKNANKRRRILFFVNDFKTDLWGAELKKFNYEVVERDKRFFSHIKILLLGHIKNNRIHAFIFRYLNDHKSLYESTLYFVRDLLIICICKLLSIKILWILHNIDRETKEHHPLLISLRRSFVQFASGKVLVTDPNLVEVAHKHGIKDEKISWLCFGKPLVKQADQKNVQLEKQIAAFKRKLKSNGVSKVYLGLCVSQPAHKKLHYLYADTIVGMTHDSQKSMVGLVFIGTFPEGPKFDDAKERIQKSPHILFLEDSFEVIEPYISAQIDFFYRSLSDQSVPYTLYIAANESKPMVTHDVGAQPLLIKREGLGLILDNMEKEIPRKIKDHVDSWSDEGSEQFLKERSWKIAATQLIRAIED